MRIAFYTDYPPYLERGGAEIRLNRLTNMLAGDNDVHVFCGGSERVNKRVGKVHYHIYKNYWEGLPIGVRNFVYVLQIIWRFILFPSKIRDFDLVDVYRPLRGCDVNSFAGSHISGFKNAGFARRVMLIPLILLECFSARGAEKIIVVSNGVKKDLVHAYGLNEDKITITYSGTDKKFLTTKHRDETPISVSAAGGLGEIKGTDTIIETVNQLRNTDIKFVIMGDGSVEKYRRMCKNNNVTFTGKVSHSEVFRELRQTQIFVHPSRADGLPMAVREAMAMQLPVIGTKVGGIPELVKDNKTGFLINVGDSKALAEKIVYLSKNPSVRKEMGERARDIIKKKFTWRKLVERTMSVYKELIKDSKGHNQLESLS